MIYYLLHQRLYDGIVRNGPLKSLHCLDFFLLLKYAKIEREEEREFHILFFKIHYDPRA